MAESHSKGEQRHYTHLVPPDPDSRSDMARASDGHPFKPYVYRGGEKEPPAVTAARERHQALNAEIALRNALIAPDLEALEAPWEWYRELHDD